MSMLSLVQPHPSAQVHEALMTSPVPL